MDYRHDSLKFSPPDHLPIMVRPTTRPLRSFALLFSLAIWTVLANTFFQTQSAQNSAGIQTLLDVRDDAPFPKRSRETREGGIPSWTNLVAGYRLRGKHPRLCKKVSQRLHPHFSIHDTLKSCCVY